MIRVSTEVPDEATRAAVLRLADRIEAEDGAPPLSDQSLAHLRAPHVAHFIALEGSELLGYAQRDGESAEVAAVGAALPMLLDGMSGAGLRIWSHGRHSRLVPVFEKRAFEPVRRLYQLRRGLEALPDEPALAPGVVVRTFEPGRDDDAWLAVNAAAFATHPEQGRWTRDDLQARMAEPWFDPAGFLLAEGSSRPEHDPARDVRILGYHWTKVHPDRLGEVYVLGIAPAAQGLGLGNALLVRGLHHLAGRGCPAVLLYVDGDNPGAMRLYERAGFAEHDLDVQWRHR